MQLQFVERYEASGLSGAQIELLSRFGDLLCRSAVNVTAVSDPAEIERRHFLDALSLLEFSEVRDAGSLIDIGSGGGLPGLVLAIACPDLKVVSLDSIGKKCAFVTGSAEALSLANIAVVCARAEEHGRGLGREIYDTAVARAVASLPVVAELGLPLVRPGGDLLAMTGAVSDQEGRDASAAAAILGADTMQARRVSPFPGARNRFVYIAHKDRSTPSEYPRRVGVPKKRPLAAGKEEEPA